MNDKEKRKIATPLLKGMRKIDVKSVTDEKGNLDVKAFNLLPEVVKVKKELLKAGIEKEWLCRTYIAAGLVLRFGDECLFGVAEQ